MNRFKQTPAKPNRRDKDISLFAPRDFVHLSDEVEEERVELLANWLTRLCPALACADAEPDITDYYNYG